MTYNFTFMYKGNIIYETYTNDTKAMLRFAYLVKNNIPFKIITMTKRHNRFHT